MTNKPPTVDELFGPGAVFDQAPDIIPMMTPGPRANNWQPPKNCGWELILGVDANGDPYTLTGGLIPPPGRLRRFLTWLMLGWRWEKIPAASAPSGRPGTT